MQNNEVERKMVREEVRVRLGAICIERKEKERGGKREAESERDQEGGSINMLMA